MSILSSHLPSRFPEKLTRVVVSGLVQDRLLSLMFSLVNMVDSAVFQLRSNDRKQLKHAGKLKLKFLVYELLHRRGVLPCAHSKG